MRDAVVGQQVFTAPMPELDRKSRYFASANVQRTRDVHGRARR